MLFSIITLVLWIILIPTLVPIMAYLNRVYDRLEDRPNRQAWFWHEFWNNIKTYFMELPLWVYVIFIISVIAGCVFIDFRILQLIIVVIILIIYGMIALWNIGERMPRYSLEDLINWWKKRKNDKVQGDNSSS